MSYTALVVRVRTLPFPNADRLLLGICNGYQVVVGKDTQDGELGIYFPADGQLSAELCAAHNLISYTDAAGERKGGFFAQNRRVRAQKFRGERSDGFWVPMSYLDFTGADASELIEGTQLTEFNGVPLCNKFETAATKAAKGQQPKTKKRNIMFAEHIDTKQLRHYADTLPAGSHIYVTEKAHGTSHRTGVVLEEVKLSKWAQLLNGITHRQLISPKSAWAFVNGTRRTILDNSLVDGYYKEGFRVKAVEQLAHKLYKGEVVYFEIVGWVNESTPIMNTHDVTKLKDKTFLAKYGPTMTYKYGQPRGSCTLLVYRITQVNEDGYVVELPWTMVKARCRQMGVKHVPELYDMVLPMGGADASRFVLDVATEMAQGESTLDPMHIREGVVLRVEMPDGTTDWFKFKSFEFSLMEGIVKDDEATVDIEEAA